MLSVPTLWVVFMVNFVALGLVWTYVVRSYPTFTAARYWMAGSLIAAAGAGLGLTRGFLDLRVAVLGGGLMLIFAVCVATMGIQRFYGDRASWRRNLAIVAASGVGLTVFSTWVENMPVRMVIYSVAQSLPIVLTLRYLLKRNRRYNPGARLAAALSSLMIAVHVVRSTAAMLQVGGGMTFVYFNDFQSAMVLALVFVSMAWNFGFLLMAIDRLRSEVASLALIDDLTGVANRRLLFQHLAEQCNLSRRTGEPFAVLAIDLDDFKAINDSRGHAAGDDCLRRFTAAAQSKLRPGDVLARIGGDEFCIVLPATTLREAAMMARRVLETCNETDACGCAISVSVGVAQWTKAIGRSADMLMAHADEALYQAKKLGKQRFAIYEPPGAHEPVHDMRKIA